VSSVEDPEKMLEQTVNEMQSDLIKMRQASAQARPRTLFLCYISYLLRCSCARRQSVDFCAKSHGKPQPGPELEQAMMLCWPVFIAIHTASVDIKHGIFDPGRIKMWTVDSNMCTRRSWRPRNRLR